MSRFNDAPVNRFSDAAPPDAASQYNYNNPNQQPQNNYQPPQNVPNHPSQNYHDVHVPPQRVYGNANQAIVISNSNYQNNNQNNYAYVDYSSQIEEYKKARKKWIFSFILLYVIFVILYYSIS